MRDHALRERHALAQTLRRAGPDAPTLCGAWTTAQLAAHVVLREHSLIEVAAQLPIKRIRRQGERLLDDLVRREPYDRLVDLVDRGPRPGDLGWLLPTAPVWSLPVVREAFNVTEYLIHHEDVRRAGGDDWEPRALPVDLQMAVWKRLPFTVRVAMRKVPVGVELCWPGHGTARNAAARRGVAVRIVGDPMELVLFASGRVPQARVDYEGEADAVALVRGSKIAL